MNVNLITKRNSSLTENYTSGYRLIIVIITLKLCTFITKLGKHKYVLNEENPSQSPRTLR